MNRRWILAGLLLSACLTAKPTTGVTVDQFGRPVVGASVVLLCGGQPQESHTTGEAGQFTLQSRPAADCLLLARAASDQRSAYGNAVEPVGQTDTRLVLPYVGRVTGQVVDEQGAPLSDLQVGNEHFQHGSFALALRRPGEPLELSAPGFATETITLGPPDQFGDVALPPTTLTRPQVRPWKARWCNSRSICRAIATPGEPGDVAPSPTVTGASSSPTSRGGSPR